MNEIERDAISQLVSGIMDENPNSSEVSDQIKDILLYKASEKIEAIRPQVYSASFEDDSVE